MAICTIVSITVPAATIALWLRHRMKNISSRGPYLSSRKSANWNDAPIFILVFSNSFLHQSSYFFSLTWAMVSIFQLCCYYLFSATVYSLSLNVTDQVWADAAPAWGRGTATSMHKNDWHFSDTPLCSDWLCWSGSGGLLQIKLQPLGGTQTVDFYTADLYIILMSNHNDNFSKYNQTSS